MTKKRPPNQLQPGQTGNPKGRPDAAALYEVLNGRNTRWVTDTDTQESPASCPQIPQTIHKLTQRSTEVVNAPNLPNDLGAFRRKKHGQAACC